MGKKKKNHAPLIILSVLLAALAATAVLWTRTKFVNTEAQTVEVFSSYQDNVEAYKYHVLLPMWKTPQTVTPVDQLDTSTLGKQVLTYKCGDLTVEKTVEVKDLTAPVITLVKTDGYTLPGKDYVEEGYQATDNYDGDLTDQVTSEFEDGKIIYTVTDKSGNKGQEIREINYEMRVPPVLNVTSQTIHVGTTFTDKVSATDEAGNDISDRIQVKGTVDTSKKGVYELTYTVEDDYGNRTTKTAKINVVEKQTVIVDPNSDTQPTGSGGVIYLTFDDGPSPYETQLLATLKKYNVKVTFFVTGNRDKYRDHFKDMHDQGHVVAAHSYTHNFSKIYKSTDAFWEDYKKIQDLIFEYTGEKTTLLRFAGGSSNTVSRSYKKGIMTELVKQADEKGITYFDWNVSAGDAGGAKTPEAVFNNLVRGVSKRKTSVVLSHSTKKCTVDAMELFIPWALQNGYVFKVLTPDSPTAHQRVNN